MYMQFRKVIFFKTEVKQYAWLFHAVACSGWFSLASESYPRTRQQKHIIPHFHSRSSDNCKMVQAYFSFGQNIMRPSVFIDRQT